MFCHRNVANLAIYLGLVLIYLIFCKFNFHQSVRLLRSYSTSQTYPVSYQFRNSVLFIIFQFEQFHIIYLVYIFIVNNFESNLLNCINFRIVAIFKCIFKFSKSQCWNSKALYYYIRTNLYHWDSKAFRQGNMSLVATVTATIALTACSPSRMHFTKFMPKVFQGLSCLSSYMLYTALWSLAICFLE